jgi:hypothetical protein
VIALTIGLLSLLVGVVVAPLIAAFQMPSVEQGLSSADDIGQVKESINSLFHIFSVAETVAGVAFLIAALCFAYCFVLWATSFIGR